MSDLIDRLKRAADTMDARNAYAHARTVREAVALIESSYLIPLDEIKVVTKTYGIAPEIVLQAPADFMDLVHEQYLQAMLAEVQREGFLLIELPERAMVSNLDASPLDPIRFTLTAKARRLDR